MRSRFRVQCLYSECGLLGWFYLVSDYAAAANSGGMRIWERVPVMWIQYLYTVPPTDANFIISVRKVLDADGDGRWNWQDGRSLEYQQ